MYSATAAGKGISGLMVERDRYRLAKGSGGYSSHI
jgi:hypothetical protein